jgi:ABC-type branched-subunit amino acid transport system ATPase component
LTGHADARATALPGRQQRRLDVALALIGDGELIFLE